MSPLGLELLSDVAEGKCLDSRLQKKAICDKLLQHEMLNHNNGYTIILADTSQQQRQIGTFGEFLSHNKDFYAMRS